MENFVTIVLVSMFYQLTNILLFLFVFIIFLREEFPFFFLHCNIEIQINFCITSNSNSEDVDRLTQQSDISNVTHLLYTSVQNSSLENAKKFYTPRKLSGWLNQRSVREKTMDNLTQISYRCQEYNLLYILSNFQPILSK